MGDSVLRRLLMVLSGGAMLAVLAACSPLAPAPAEGAGGPEGVPPTMTVAPTQTPEPTEAPMEDEAVSDDNDDADLSGPIWVLIETIVGGDAVVPAPDFAGVFFSVDEGMVFGESGCNSFRGAVEIGAGSIKFGPLMTTRMACPEARMTLETTVLDLLSRATAYTLTDGVLELRDGDDLPLARFAAGEEATLYVGPETVACEGVAPQQCLQVRETPDEAYRLFYDAIVGFEHEPGATYELRVAVTEVAAPPMDAASLRTTLLSIVSVTEADRSDEAPQLVGPVWQWARAVDAAGEVSEVADPERYTLEFGGDGTYAVLADCNRGSGAVTVDDATISFQPGPMTMMACGPASRDAEYVFGLLSATGYSFDDAGHLVLHLADNGGQLQFQPAAAD